MSYTSLVFAGFVIALLIVYYLVPKKFQWAILLIGSAVFYALAAKYYSIFILITIISIFFAAQAIERINAQTSQAVKANKETWSRDEKKAFKASQEKKAKGVLILALVINFGALFTIKYFGGYLGGIIMPLGISFYTFQTTGYLIDVYRENVEAEKNIFKLALFVSFFPQIVQGPIGEFDKLQHQLTGEHSLTWLNFKLGVQLVIWGMFKKLIVADRTVKVITHFLEGTGTDNYPHEGPWSGTAILFVVLVYAVQLYADFSGGIDISRGVAKLFGIDLAINFRQPYFATSLNDYWRRWHITLGAWMKKYIFYSLAASGPFLKLGRNISKGGSKPKDVSAEKTASDGSSAFNWRSHIGKTLPAAIATFVVFIFVGAWHGSNMKYIAFGIWNGGVMMISMLLEPWFIRMREGLKINPESFLHRLFQMARTFILVLVGYYFDVAKSLSDSMDMFKRTFTDQSIKTFAGEWRSLGVGKMEYLVIIFGVLVMFYFSVRLEKTKLETPGDLIEKRHGILQWIIIFIACCAIITLGVYGPGYNAADFVYMQF